MLGQEGAPAADAGPQLRERQEGQQPQQQQPQIPQEHNTSAIGEMAMRGLASSDLHITEAVMALLNMRRTSSSVEIAAVKASAPMRFLGDKKCTEYVEGQIKEMKLAGAAASQGAASQQQDLFSAADGEDDDGGQREQGSDNDDGFDEQEKDFATAAMGLGDENSIKPARARSFNQLVAVGGKPAVQDYALMYAHRGEELHGMNFFLFSILTREEKKPMKKKERDLQEDGGAGGEDDGDPFGFGGGDDDDGAASDEEAAAAPGRQGAAAAAATAAGNGGGTKQQRAARVVFVDYAETYPNHESVATRLSYSTRLPMLSGAYVRYRCPEGSKRPHATATNNANWSLQTGLLLIPWTAATIDAVVAGISVKRMKDLVNSAVHHTHPSVRGIGWWIYRATVQQDPTTMIRRLMASAHSSRSDGIGKKKEAEEEDCDEDIGEDDEIMQKKADALLDVTDASLAMTRAGRDLEASMAAAKEQFRLVRGDNVNPDPGQGDRFWQTVEEGVTVLESDVLIRETMKLTKMVAKKELPTPVLEQMQPEARRRVANEGWYDVFGDLDELNREQKEVFNAAVHMGIKGAAWPEKDRIMLLHAAPGCGKTFVTRRICRLVRAYHGSYASVLCCAFAGIAAYNLEPGGRTICGAFGINTRNKGEKDNKPSIRNAGDLKLVVIDEISMVSAATFGAIDARLRKITGKPNEAFGGACILIIGDFFQIEPVGGTALHAAALGIKKAGEKKAKITVEGLNGDVLHARGAMYFRSARLFEMKEQMRAANCAVQKKRLDDIRSEKKITRDIYYSVPVLSVDDFNNDSGWNSHRVLCTTNDKVAGFNFACSERFGIEHGQFVYIWRWPLPAELRGLPLPEDRIDKMYNKSRDATAVFVRGGPFMLIQNVNQPLGLANGVIGYANRLIYDGKVAENLGDKHDKLRFKDRTFRGKSIKEAIEEAHRIARNSGSINVKLPLEPDYIEVAFEIPQAVQDDPNIEDEYPGEFKEIDVIGGRPGEKRRMWLVLFEACTSDDIKMECPPTEANPNGREFRLSAIPVRAAFSMTAHKAQGQTLGHYAIDLSKKKGTAGGTNVTFEIVNVALSRTSFDSRLRRMPMVTERTTETTITYSDDYIVSGKTLRNYTDVFLNGAWAPSQEYGGLVRDYSDVPDLPHVGVAGAAGAAAAAAGAAAPKVAGKARRQRAAAGEDEDSGSGGSGSEGDDEGAPVPPRNQAAAAAFPKKAAPKKKAGAKKKAAKKKKQARRRVGSDDDATEEDSSSEEESGSGDGSSSGSGSGSSSSSSDESDDDDVPLQVLANRRAAAAAKKCATPKRKPSSKKKAAAKRMPSPSSSSSADSSSGDSSSETSD